MWNRFYKWNNKWFSLGLWAQNSKLEEYVTVHHLRPSTPTCQPDHAPTSLNFWYICFLLFDFSLTHINHCSPLCKIMGWEKRWSCGEREIMFSELKTILHVYLCVFPSRFKCEQERSTFISELQAKVAKWHRRPIANLIRK